MTGNEKGGSRSAINSRLENLRNLSPAARLDRVGDVVSLTDTERNVFAGGGLPIALADGMIENVIGTFELPIGVATNFTINGRDYLIPMAVEEPSVVAAASYMARLARKSGGFVTSSTGPIMRAQVQVLEVRDPHGARARILKRAGGDHCCSKCQGQGSDLAWRRVPRYRSARLRSDNCRSHGCRPPDRRCA